MPQSKPQWLALLSQADELFYGGAAGGGKGLALDTPIRTPSGYVLMGDLHVGDFVYDENGHSCKVTFVTDPVLRDCYLLTFDDGSTLLADDVHRWLTYDAKELNALTRKDPEWRARRRANRPSRALGNKSAAFVEALNKRNAAYAVVQTTPPPSGTMRDTKEIFSSLLTPSGRRNHAIQVAKTIELPEVELPLDPYLLGVWLGDGTTVNSTVSGIDEEIFDAFKRVGFKTTRYTYCVRNILGLGKYLRKVGVLGNKHIPDDYLFSSSDQRLALLQGLMDTDGTIAKDGQSQFTSTNKKLVDGVYDLVVSLGIKATICEGRSKLYNKYYGPVWDVSFTTSMPVFRLDRKLTRLRKQEQIRRVSAFRYIVKCEPVPSVPTRCIAVDSPSHLYLAGKSLIPTHNTDLLLGLAVECHQHSHIFRRVYPNLSGITLRAREIIRDHAQENKSNHNWTFPDGRTIEFGAVQREDDKYNWQGRPGDFKAFDEITEFSESQYVFMCGWNRSVMPGQRVRVLATGNPPFDESGHWVVRRWGAWLDDKHPCPAQPGELRWYATVKGKEQEFPDGNPVTIGTEIIYPRSRTFIPALLDDNPFLTQDPHYRSVIQSMPEPLRSMLLYGDFHASTKPNAFQVIPTEWVRAAQRRWMERAKPTTSLSAVGIDAARGGDDYMTLVRRYGNYWDSGVKWPGVLVPDGPTGAALIQAEMSPAEKPGAVNIDVIGIGSSLYDCVSQMYEVVNPVNVSARSEYWDKSGALKMRNLRAELVWRMRDALDPASGEDVALPNDPELLSDLCAPTYKPTVSGVLIESKEEIKKRIGRSPDYGDAAELTLFVDQSEHEEYIEYSERVDISEY